MQTNAPDRVTQHLDDLEYVRSNMRRVIDGTWDDSVPPEKAATIIAASHNVIQVIKVGILADIHIREISGAHGSADRMIKGGGSDR